MSIYIGSKHFIIARVQTWDHKQPDRAFYSYYHAHHLNKLLFQTQVYLDKKLIHRLHVLNPLTNTDIIGNVLYFMVVGKNGQRQVVPGPAASAPGNIGVQQSKPQAITTSNPGNQKTPESQAAIGSPTKGPILRIDTASAATSPRLDTSKVPTSPSVSTLPPFRDAVMLNRAIHHRPPDAIQEEDEQRAPQANQRTDEGIAQKGWILNGPLTASATEGDVAPIPESDISTNGSVVVDMTNAKRRKSSFQAVSEKFQKSVMQREGFSKIEESPSVATSIGSGAGLISGQQQQGPLSPSGKKSKGLSVTTSLPTSATAAGAPLRSAAINGSNAGPFSARPGTLGVEMPLSPTTAQRKNLALPAPAGSITQHGTPLTPIQAMSVVPPSARNRRRSLSYMNAVETSGSRGASIEDWKKMVQEDRKERKKRPGSIVKEQVDTAAGHFDEVRPFGAPSSPSIRPSEIDAISPDTPSPHPKTPQQVMEELETTKEEVTYDAILLATDNDFLEQSRVRAIFRENALQLADSQLFEMPPYTGEESSNPAGANGRNGLDRMDETSLPCDFCLPTEQELRHPNTAIRAYHQVKCYVMIVVMTLVIVLFIWLIASGNQQK